MQETTIYLIRHSRQVKPNEDLYDTKLSQLQNEQNLLSEEGEQLAKNLSEEKELQNIEVLYSSNYARAVLTANYIAKKNDIKLNIDTRLGERKLRKIK